ncbi:hypothetical protein Slala05_10340 [Streptomyces lavendulae subsp. lavendulae]|nr:hypothetical protein Slala05_10340 [Streptomyces lavendulae subsp. lavendulae]
MVRITLETMVDLVKKELRGVHSWVTTVAALVALGFSCYNFAHQLEDDPRPDATLPVMLKMTRDGGGVSVFVQPTVFTRFNTPEAELFTDVRLRLRHGAGAVPEPNFYWLRNVKWFVDHGNPTKDIRFDVTWEFESDPGPFTITQALPRQPYIQFRTNDWKLAPGPYQGALTFMRQSAATPIERPFCLVLSATDVTDLSADPGWYEFRTDVPGKKQGGCYSRYG